MIALHRKLINLWHLWDTWGGTFQHMDLINTSITIKYLVFFFFKNASPIWDRQQQNESMTLVPTVDCDLQGENWRERGGKTAVLISPVCVPPVRKLHQQHELDQQEEEPADSSYVAPHCGRGQGDKDTSHTTHGISKWAFVLGNPVLIRRFDACVAKFTIKQRYRTRWS